MKTIQLTFAHLEIHEGWCETVFLDGKTYGALPHHTPEYHALAEWIGCEDIAHYCWQHEFCHHFIAQEIDGSPSRVLWPLAHGTKGDTSAILKEEALSIMFQAFLNGKIAMPATAPGVSWSKLKLKALDLLEQSEARKDAA